MGKQTSPPFTHLHTPLSPILNPLRTITPDPFHGAPRQRHERNSFLRDYRGRACLCPSVTLLCVCVSHLHPVPVWGGLLVLANTVAKLISGVLCSTQSGHKQPFVAEGWLGPVQASPCSCSPLLDISVLGDPQCAAWGPVCWGPESRAVQRVQGWRESGGESLLDCWQLGVERRGDRGEEGREGQDMLCGAGLSVGSGVVVGPELTMPLSCVCGVFDFVIEPCTLPPHLPFALSE